ncbi:HAMP domain-containing sensor histidine kinase [Demequina capsici]|uniref:histidine kinase n=1 Tax=Demequina capsici TaxID=3075620 RepID=A0AA96FC63_9MICO|nr:HAMP domain-containing sensor histidine kinase [Demequina sp. PMTSA13]WNM27639.1 HAMP domain-containing sensor histidine kinase [Demequina sp. PMTSA13]
MTRRTAPLDADARLIRDASLRVGIWIVVALSALVLLVLIAEVVIVVDQVPLGQLVDPSKDEPVITVEGRDVIWGGLIVGVLAVVLSGVLARVATRRAVAPLVDALARQRRFVADASHELRTPLAILDSRLQLLERTLATDDPARATVGELRADSRNVIGVVNDLLASVDTTEQSHAQPTEVARVIQAAASAMAVLAHERDVTIASGDVDPALAVLMPETSLQRVLIALIDNAVKHSPSGQEVAVSVEARRGRVALAVTDHGPGIRGIDPARVFERFARSSEAVDGGGSARTGFGIGLSLVQDTVGRFGGEVEVTDTSSAGTTITMRLPRA